MGHYHQSPSIIILFFSHHWFYFLVVIWCIWYPKIHIKLSNMLMLHTHTHTHKLLKNDWFKYDNFMYVFYWILNLLIIGLIHNSSLNRLPPKKKNNPNFLRIYSVASQFSQNNGFLPQKNFVFFSQYYCPQYKRVLHPFANTQS